MQDTSVMMLLAAAAIGLISLVVGAVIGIILYGIRDQPSQKSDAPPGGLQPAVRLWRSRKTGQIAVEIDQKTFYEPGELDNRRRKFLTGLVSELEQWVGVEIPANRMPSVTLPPAGSFPAGPVVGEPVTPAQPAADLGGLSSTAQPRPQIQTPGPQVRKDPKADVTPPSLELSDIISSALVQEKSKEKPVLTKSIAMQIDEIIQRRLPETAYRGRNIRLRDMPGGGISVFVDEERFTGVDDVRDLGVRELLQACIAEWERTVGND